ncbi:phosphotransferase, variant [Blastomyces dermatitidis ATCC 18188]|uniref:Phosphotransferase n=1 Tax=Ajellomyces dermatitidis (strain ATCC 18188 / CBS 674.68) TaxID=653446 RepID=F2T960_AJEDA|nr:phosphotransferase [Blastomyces dermatitidis ATCC 18188]KMW67109.1 phosphotransferase, variant [Blastomyces dermatitidis ATCC 18188]
MEPDPFTPKDGYGQVIYAFFPDMPKIIRLDEHRVLKSAITNSTETEAMKFVAANTTIPSPKSLQDHMIWQQDGLKLLKLSWNTPPANPLAKSGENSHTISRCSSVISSAASSPNVQKLRPTTTPALIESANGGPVTVGLRFPRRGGPFDSEKEFNDFLVGLNDPKYPSPL